MQQAEKYAVMALTPQQLSQLQKEMSIIEGKLSQTLEQIDLKPENLESELRQMNQKQGMDKDELEYVGLIKDCMRYKDDIMAINVWTVQGLKQTDYDHKIIKALGFTKPTPLTPTPSPQKMPVRDKQKEMYIVELRKMTNHPFIEELCQMYDFGMKNLNANIKAINAAKGNLELAFAYLLDGEDQEQIVDPYLQMVQNTKYPHMRQDLELLYKLNPTNYGENLNALQQSSGDPKSARKILLANQLRNLLNKNQVESIEDVVDLIINMYEQEKIPSTQLKARKKIEIYKDILSIQIEIWKITAQELALEFNLGEEITLEYIQDLIEDKRFIQQNSMKKGDNTKANKVAGEIKSFLQIQEKLEDVLRLEKAMNGVQDAPADPEAVYPTLPLEKRLSLLSQLLQQNNLSVYTELLGNDSDIENSEAFQTVIKPFKTLIQGSKWDRVSVNIFKTFLKGDLNGHFVMKIYLNHKQFLDTSPLVMYQAYEAIKKMDVPEECKETHQDFIDNFTRIPFKQLYEQIDEIEEEFESYKAELADKMKPAKLPEPSVQPQNIKIVPDTAFDQLLIPFEADFLQYRGFKMAREALHKKDILGASQLIRTLMGEIAGDYKLEGKFCEIYTVIIKILPDFQNSLSEDQVFSTFAPAQIKNAVTELFRELKKQMRHASHERAQQEEQKGDSMNMVLQNGQLSKLIAEKLEEICFEDARFKDILFQYLTESTDYAQIVSPYLTQIKSLKSHQQEHLMTAFRQIDSKDRGPHRISEFMAVDIDMDLQALQVDIGKWYSESQKLDGKTITIVLYDLIKKRCTFDKFITLLSQKSMDCSVDMLFTQQFFLSYLLNNSDTYLRTMILMACSFFMPLPLVSYQPKQQQEDILIPSNFDQSNEGGEMMSSSQQQEMENQSNKVEMEFCPQVYKELFYCFEKHMAVLSFKLSANPNKSPHGCTSLTNDVFNRAFQTHSKSLVNYGSIEIQFDYNFEHPMFVPVADAHGLVEEDILERVYPMFNIFLIHSFEGPEHEAIVKSHIKKIKQSSENPLIFQIIHDQCRRDNSFNTSQVGNIIKINLGRYSELLELQKSNLRNKIVEHYLRHIGKFQAYESDIKARLNSLKQFCDFASGFRAFRSQLMEVQEAKFDEGFNDQMQLTVALDITINFLTMIDNNKELLRSDRVLTMNVLFEEACRLEKIMIRDTSLKSEICEEYRQKVELLYQQMKEAMLSKLALELRNIIEHQNYLGLASMISKFIRSLLNKDLQPLLKQREDLRSRVQKQDDKQDDKDEMYIQIGDISKILEKRWYSNEFLYRESYISELSKLRSGDTLADQPFKYYLSLVALQISQGQPFEIIDGNNLQFIKEVYQRIEGDRMQQEEILVVSVIGPQSSGKSLLLNTLFGAQFLSSAGRCTRGIYGCLIDINSEIKQTPFKKILILDTEGIQSTEALDEGFDKRVVFYILCVSHIVLICNKGEMNKNMEDTIKLATDCIMQVREKIDQQPQVNIIMNNVQINENSLYQTTENLSKCIMEMRRYQKLRKIFTIDQSNVFLLPNAFAQSGNEQFVAYQPSYQFAQKVDQLRKRIYNYMQSSTIENTASFTLETWFHYAQNFWEFTDGYVGLTEYSTLEERNEDILLFEFTKKLIADNFENKQKVSQHQQIILEEVTKVLEQHGGFDQTNINIIKTKIDNALYPRIKEVELRIQDEFRKFIDEKGIRPQIKKKRFEQLDTQIRQHIFNWQQRVQKLLGEFNQKKSKFIGDKSLQNAIDKYIIDFEQKITVEMADEIFKKEWEIIEIEMKNQLKSAKQISEEQFQDIGQLYRANPRSIINIDQERALIAQYQSLDSSIIIDKLRQQGAFFFYNSKTIKPSIEKFKEQINRNKNFLSKKIDYFEENNAQEFYDWKKVVQERFNFAAYETNISSASLKVQKNWCMSSERKGITDEKVKEVISQIREEAENFNIDITEQFVAALTNLEKLDIQPFILKQKKEYKREYSSQQEISDIQRIIKKYVDNMKNSIEVYFKFKRLQNKHRNEFQMRYFDSYNIRDVKTSFVQRRDQFATFKYNVQIQMDPQNLRINEFSFNQINVLEPIKKIQTYFKIKPQIRDKDPQFFEYLQFLVQSDKKHFASGSKPVERALSTLFKLVDHDKLIKNIQQIVLENIFRDAQQNQHSTVEELVQYLIEANEPDITEKFCAIDFNTIQRIVVRIEAVVGKINEDMEPFCFIVSEHGNYFLHQIAQTYIIRIMQEVIRLTEHAPLYTFIQTKNTQRDLFIAKLTSNDKEMDVKLAERTGQHLAQTIIKKVKEEQIQEFQRIIEAEENLFKLRTIIKNIENQMLQIADGKLPNPFEVDGSSQADEKNGQIITRIINNVESQEMHELFGSYDEEEDLLNQNFFDMLKGPLEQQDKQEEGKKEESFKQKMSRLNKANAKLQFSPEEIIKFYVQPSEFLKKKFQDQWAKTTGIEIKRAKKQYEKKIEEINQNFQVYFQKFQKQVESKKIQLAANAFIPDDQDHLDQQAFKIQCQKAMAIYLGLVVNKQWKAGTAISVDDNVKMIVPENMSLVTHEDIVIDLLQPFASILQQSIQNELISNIDNFIKSLMSEMTIGLEIQVQAGASGGQNGHALQENELIGNLYQVMKTKTLGCDQMCPLCRRQCDQSHDGDLFPDRIHRCEVGHQIQGFGGNRHKMNNKAITYGCHELVEKDMVVWQGNDMKWKKFKEEIFADRKWDWDHQDNDLGAKQLIKEKNMKIWNLVGPLICEYYRLEQHIDIQFIKADMDAKRAGAIQNTFYILMLDNSLSMSWKDTNGSSKWMNLKSAVSQFIANIEKDILLKNNSKLSIITYNSEAKLELEAQVPSQDLLQELQAPDGNTDFNPPLNIAKDLIEKYQESFDSFVLVMMSDGESGYPQESVEKIKKSPAKNKIKFKAISYGGDSGSLTKMAQELGGSCENILEPNQLSGAFVQMIPNLYAQ